MISRIGCPKESTVEQRPRNDKDTFHLYNFFYGRDKGRLQGVEQ